MTVVTRIMIVKIPKVGSLREISNNTLNLSLKDANSLFRRSKLDDLNFCRR